MVIQQLLCHQMLPTQHPCHCRPSSCARKLTYIALLCHPGQILLSLPDADLLTVVLLMPCVTAIARASLELRSFIRQSKACHCTATSQEVRPGFSRHGYFSFSIKPVLPVKSDRESSAGMRQLNAYLTELVCCNAISQHKDAEKAMTDARRSRCCDSC